MIRLSDVSFRYERRKNTTIHDINLCIKPGERILISGRTGCGKSTLLKVISGLIPLMSTGEFKGAAYVNGEQTIKYSPSELGAIVGCVYQNPDDQLFAVTVEDEVAFALENQSVDQAEIKTRVQEVLREVGLDGLSRRAIHTLSGGQRQRLALASVLVTRPRVLILDEPVSQLNPQAVSSFLALLIRLNEAYGITLIVVEHRVHELEAYFPRLCLMSEGRIVYDGPTANVWEFIGDKNVYGLREPESIKLCRAMGIEPLISSIEKLAGMIKGRLDTTGVCSVSSGYSYEKRSDAVLFEDVSFSYQSKKQLVLDKVSFAIGKGEAVALMGNNGAGKSTLLNILSGLSRQGSGKVLLLGDDVAEKMHKVGYLRQEPDLMILKDTVREEVAFGPQKTGQEVEFALKSLHLERHMEDYPLALSKGQRLRVVLAAIMAGNPELVLLDEPTTGQDYQSLLDIKKVIDIYKKSGGSVFFCTHDTELAAEIADRVLILENGHLIANGRPEEVFLDTDIVKRGGLNLLPMFLLTMALGIPPMLKVEEVACYVGKGPA